MYTYICNYYNHTISASINCSEFNYTSAPNSINTSRRRRRRYLRSLQDSKAPG